MIVCFTYIESVLSDSDIACRLSSTTRNLIMVIDHLSAPKLKEEKPHNIVMVLVYKEN